MTEINRRTRSAGLFLLLLACAAALPGSAFAQQDIPARVDDLVVDFAGVLSDAEAQSLRTKLEAFDRETSTQLLIVTMPTLDGADPAQFATELGQQWGVGQAGKDNGAVVLVSIGDRQVFIATGYGLEGAITDAEASRIVRNVIVPNFRQGNFYAGLSGAADALMEASRGEFAPEPARTGGAPSGTDWVVVVLVVIILLFVIGGLLSNHKGGGGSNRRDDDHFGQRRRSRRSDGFPIIIGGGGWGRSSGGFGGGGFGGGGFGGFGGGGFGGGGAGGGW